MSQMIVVTRNGKTVVLTGWRAWLAGAVALLLGWALFVLVAALVIGIGLTVGTLMLLAIPAIIGVALLGSVFARWR